MASRHVALVFSLALVVPFDVLAGNPPPVNVAARLYNSARVATHVTREGLDVARRTLSRAAVELHWSECDTSAACEQPLVARELIVRLVRSPIPPNLGRLQLGDAFVDPSTRAGALATVYVDRVEYLAVVSGIGPAALLGYAIAHEVGHLLLATTAHSARGLMRATWSREEIQRRRYSDWLFTAEQVDAIRSRFENLNREAREDSTEKVAKITSARPPSLPQHARR
jgi:hypothetical protein